MDYYVAGCQIVVVAEEQCVECLPEDPFVAAGVTQVRAY